jgi:hypothetical protein
MGPAFTRAETEARATKHMTIAFENILNLKLEGCMEWIDNEVDQRLN